MKQIEDIEIGGLYEANDGLSIESFCIIPLVKTETKAFLKHCESSDGLGLDKETMEILEDSMNRDPTLGKVFYCFDQTNYRYLYVELKYFGERLA